MSKKLLYMCLMTMMMVFSMSAYALDKKDGVYQIGTADDLEEFAALVNGGEVYANAVLTADIDRGIDGTMIGVADQEGKRYDGTFDGQGHTIKINMFPEAQDAALFRYAGWRSVIQNLKVEGTITTGSKFAAGIVGRNRGVIRNCYADVTINSSVPGDATHGGIVGVGYSGTIIENCLAKIAIVGETTQNCGGVVGWAETPCNIVNCLVVSNGSNFDLSTGLSRNIARNDSRVKAVDLETYNQDIYANRPGGACYNNYVTVDWGANPATTVVPLEDLADGRICYQLNNDQSRIGWVQRIGTDPFPVPAPFGSGQVYASAPTGCDGHTDADLVLTFSNEGSDQAAKHQFDKYGICSNCGCFNFHYFEYDNPEKFDKTDRAALLKSAEDIDVAEGMNRICNGFKLNMKMANDIEYIAEPGQYIFNPSDWIDANFNGDGHTLTIEMSEVGNYASFMPQGSSTFQNVIMHGSIQTTGMYAGSISGEGRQTAIRNVYSDINITFSDTGDRTSGGLLGMIRNTKSIENCIYAGDLNIPRDIEVGGCARVGGVAGWTHTQCTVTNVAILGHLNGAGCPDENGTGDTENSMNIARNPGNIIAENVYVAHPITSSYVRDLEVNSKKFTHYQNEEGIANGELAFFLNSMKSGLDRFFQLIGTDPVPMPFEKEGALVYANAPEYRCDGTPLGETTYSNTYTGEPVIPDHHYVNGFCTVCGKFQDDLLAPVDGYFEIHDASEFVWWCQYANFHSDAKLKLMEDIDMAGYNDDFVPVGLFVGEFDGQGHTFSNVDISGGDYFGIISLIGDGANIHDFTFDESCSISGNAFVGIIGGTSGSGNIYIDRVGNAGNVTGNAQNICGILGVDVGGSMTLHISNCWFTGTILAGRESAAMCGYSGSDSEVTNCWGAFSINEAGIYDCDSFTRGSAKVTNCYEADIEGVSANKQQHVRAMADNRKCNAIQLEEVASGSLCFKLNGNQFRDPTWYQTLGEDEQPYPYSDHGVVVYAAGQYMTISEETLPNVSATIANYYTESISEVVAYTGAIEHMQEKITELGTVTTIADFADAMDSIYAAEEALNVSAQVYKKYQTRCEDTKTYLAEHDDFAGTDRDALEAYLEDDYVEIMENHELPDSLIEKEITHVEEMLALAIKNGYIPGSEVTSLFVNTDFHNDFKDGWESSMNKWGTGRSAVTIDEKANYGCEAWNTKFDMHQTANNLKPGYYLVCVNGAFRPSNNRYGYNYAAQVYANGNANYLQTVIEDYTKAGDAVNGENVYLEQFGGGNTTYDLPIYEDMYSTSSSEDNPLEILGYAVHGPSGMAVAGYAGRYKNYIIAKAENNSLTIGITNPGTNYGNDWTGFANFKVIYAGEEDAAEEYIDIALESQLARANTILEIYRSPETMELMDNEALAPSYPAALKEALQAAVAAADAAEGVEAKMKSIETLTQLFKEFYEARQAYLAVFNAASIVEYIETGNLALVEKDPETGEWTDTGENIFSADDTDALFEAYNEMYSAYTDGAYTPEEALQAAKLNIPAISSIVPPIDEEGYYQISTPKQFAAYRAIASEYDATVKAKLMNDIDLAGIAMEPIGHNRSGENAVHIYRGVLDGQGHAINNVYIDETYTQGGEPATLFYELKSATIKNFKITGDYYNTRGEKFMGGLTRWTSEGSTIDNCEIAVVMHSYINGDGTHGGVVGVSGDNTVIKNCLVNVTMIGENPDGATYQCGGVSGWANNAPTITNTLILSQYENITKGVNGNVIGRNGYTANNVFYIARSNPGFDTGGTLVSDEQLASGEITYKLNGSQSDKPVWFQTLGTDAAPRLFGGGVVYYYADEYTNEKPNIQLNAFASNLSTATTANQVIVAYTLNAEAKSAAINFYAGEELKYSHVLKGGELAAGAHEVAIDNSLLNVAAGTQMTYDLDVTSNGVKAVSKIGESYKVWGPYGMVVNNNPASKGFGQMLIVESYPQEIKDIYISHDKPGALYAFDVNFQPVNSADGTPGFYGGLPIRGEVPLAMAGTYQFDLRDLRFTADGRLFVARASGVDASSVYEINPEDLDEPWKPLFKGGTLDAATGITYVGEEEQNRMALGLAFEGKGDDLKMYVLGGQRSNGGNNTTDYNCSIYNLGTATEWTGARSANFDPLDGVYTYSSVDVGIYEDGQGGLWYIQNRTTDVNPALKHFDATGKEDYSSLTSTSSGKMTITPDGKYLAIPQGSGKIVLYETNYAPMANGKIFLNPVRTINVSETRITGLAFDYANNLYVTSASTETLSRYAIPSWNDNKAVTPAREGFTVGTESGDPDAIKGVNGNANNGAIYNIAGQRVSKAQKGIYIQDGRKVSVK